MYYCKLCGNVVKSTDMFCDKCGTVLNNQNMVDMYEMSNIKSPVENGEFSPDSCITQHNISGAVIFGYRLINKECSLLGWDYYKATKIDSIETFTMTIAHTIITKDMFYDLCYLNMSLSEEDTNKLMEEYVSNLMQSQKNFSDKCNSKGIISLVKDMKYLKSTLHETYHIFLLLEDSIPLVKYYAKNELSTEDIAKIGLNIVNTSMKLDISSNEKNILNDANVFINNQKDIFFFNSLNDVYAKYFIVTPYTIYNKIFESPYKENRLMYSIGVIMYRMLNQGRNMFQNGVFENKTYYKMEHLKQKKILPIMEISMDCLLGKIIEYSISNFDSEEKSMYILKTLLERNYS